MTYRIEFACGASYEDLSKLPYTSHTKADGRIRLAVYDSEGGLTRPAHDNRKWGGPWVAAPCLAGCPAKKASGRKQTRAFPSNGRAGVRYVVSCYGKVEES